MCERLVLANGVSVLVCGAVSARPQFCSCGRSSIALCDWKVADHQSGTCDKPICAQHSKRVAPNKHLCPEHQLRYQQWQRRRGVPTQGELFQEAV